MKYADPKDGRKTIVEFKVINQNPTRYPREVATELRASVNKGEHQLYPGYVASSLSKDSELLHTPAGTVGPLERRFTSITNTQPTSI
jgi:hypothetical protein